MIDQAWRRARAVRGKGKLNVMKAREFDEWFEAGEDVDWPQARRTSTEPAG